jgi:transposase
MEACSGAHHWARLFQAHGHTVRLMAPKLVAPYRLSGKKGKNDAADAAAICEAVTRPSMCFVPPKSVQQQSELLVHRARQGFVQQRTATINRIRGLLSEFGVVLPLKAATVRREAMHQLEDLPGWANTVIGDLLSQVHRLDERIAQYDRHIETIARDSATARQLMQLPGVGPTTATAMVAMMIGRGQEFKCSRQLSAWLELVPGQYSSGAKQRRGESPRRATVEDASNELPGSARLVLDRAVAHWRSLEVELAWCDAEIARHADRSSSHSHPVWLANPGAPARVRARARAPSA